MNTQVEACQKAPGAGGNPAPCLIQQLWQLKMVPFGSRIKGHDKLGGGRTNPFEKY